MTDSPSIRYRKSTDPKEALMLLPMLESIEKCYPNFRRWYLSKVIPGIMKGTGTLIVAEQMDSVVGVAVGKHDGGERKIRCLRVDPRARNNGIGAGLLDRMMKELGTDFPLITVSEEMLHGLSRILVNTFRYNLTSVEKGLYRPEKLEYIFNGNH